MSDAEVPLPRHRANGTATGIESMPSAGLVSETQVMRQEEPGRGDPIGPLDWRKILPFEVAVHAGFSDQSVYSHHFKRLVGVTPGQFRTLARIK
jgi:hypothetical protein